MGWGTARPARVLTPALGMATPSLVPDGQPEGRGGRDLALVPSLRAPELALARQRCPRTLWPALLAAASAICALVFIVPFYCLPPALSVGRRWQTVLSPQHLCSPPCPCEVPMPFPHLLPGKVLTLPCLPSCLGLLAGWGRQAEAGMGLLAGNASGGQQA